MFKQCGIGNFVVGQSSGNFIDDLMAIEKASFDSESNSSFIELWKL
jgi:hypothetical protein